MRRFALLVLLWCAILAAAACGGTEQGIPDTEIGLARGAADDAPPPEAVPFNDSDPGELPPRPAAFEGAPPVIPHSIDAFLPITANDNACIDCHEVEEKLEGEATPIPASHYIDQRRAPNVRADTLAGARYRCVACHVAQTGAPLLVANDFGENR